MTDETALNIDAGLDADLKDIFNKGFIETALLIQVIRELKKLNGSKAEPGTATEPVLKTN